MRNTNRCYLVNWDFFIAMPGEREELFHTLRMTFMTLKKKEILTCYSVGITTVCVMGREREFGDFIYSQNVSLVQLHWKMALLKNLPREGK